MPRKSKPPRLWLRKRSDGAAQWVILDGGSQISTGASEGDNATAENELSKYIAIKHRPNFYDGHPSKILISDVLSLYAKDRAPHLRRPKVYAHTIDLFLQFFQTSTVSQITPESTARFTQWRVKNGIKASTTRRELATLVAALNWCWKNGKLDRKIYVALPPAANPRERHITRSEAAKLIAATLGFDANGKRHQRRISRHIARFVLIALYTGTRHDAILRLKWEQNSEGGWIDLSSGVIHRRAWGGTDTRKRKPPMPIPARLLPHLLRWRRLTGEAPIEFHGRPVIGDHGVLRGFVAAVELAGLSDDITPHILRHTCVTWMLQAGVSVYDVAGVVGASEAVIRSTYGHYSQDRLKAATDVFSRKRVK